MTNKTQKDYPDACESGCGLTPSVMIGFVGGWRVCTTVVEGYEVEPKAVVMCQDCAENKVFEPYRRMGMPGQIVIMQYEDPAAKKWYLEAMSYGEK